jgi:hypothetical protein
VIAAAIIADADLNDASHLSDFYLNNTTLPIMKGVLVGIGDHLIDDEGKGHGLVNMQKNIVYADIQIRPGIVILIKAFKLFQQVPEILPDIDFGESFSSVNVVVYV